MRAVKPFYSWVGGKRRVLDFIEECLPAKFGNYHGPFLGGGAVALHVMARHPEPTYYLSDLNKELINAWECVRDTPEDVIEISTIHSERMDKQYFLYLRNHDRRGTLHLLSPEERAARFITLCNNAFGGMYAENEQGHCRSSFGMVRTLQIDNLRAVSELLNTRNVILNAQSFERGLDHVTAGDLVYLDPPYADDADDGTDTFTGYVKQTTQATDTFQQAVKRYMNRLTQKGAFALASNADTATTRELFDGWNTISKSIYWTLAQESRVATERLYGNYLLTQALSDREDTIVV